MADTTKMLPIANFTKVPVAKLTTPRNGLECRVNYWWAVTDDDCVLYYKGHSPQCNSDIRVVEHIAQSIPLTTRPMLLPVAYLEPRS
jgi:hypothetical protein